MDTTTLPTRSTRSPEPEDDLALRAVLACARRQGDQRQAERALLQATQDLAVCSCAAWEKQRSDGTTAETLFVELQQTRLLLREARERAEILAARLEKIGPRHRPYYTPALRFRILEHMKKYLLDVEETARRFLVTPQTLYTWLAEVRQHPDRDVVGFSVRPVPPVRTFSRAVRRLIRQMHDAGFGGKRKIAEILLRNAWTVSPRTVGRIRKEKPLSPAPEDDGPRHTTVRGDHPNHLWLMDITEIPTLFPFLNLHLTAVPDACSRLPLAATLRLVKPSASEAVALLRRSIGTHGPPRHLVVDQGSQFTATEFQEFVDAQKIQIRYGAVGETHSLGLIDRFFRTLKDSLGLRSHRPWNVRELRRRLGLGLVHYAYVRPHASLGGFTPIEVYYGIRGHLPRPASPPRQRPGTVESEIPFAFVFLDPKHRAFPVLVPKAA
jgi:transposase InsO family protein